MSTIKTYKEVAYQTLAGFQLIEEALKAYITQYYKGVSLVLRPELVFNFVIEDHQNVPLLGLLDRFKKINGNTKLIAEIKSLVKQRDELAHRALAAVFNEKNTNDFYIEQVKILLPVARRLLELDRQLLDEIHLITKSITKLLRKCG